MTDFTPGMRVTWNEAENPLRFDGPEGVLAGTIRDIVNDKAQVVRDDKHANTFGYWNVPLSILRPESAPVEIPGDTECAACSGACGADCYRAGPNAFDFGAFNGAPLCHHCAHKRGSGEVEKAIRSRGGWPRKQAEVETWHGFAKGERVTHRFGPEYDGAVDGHDGTCGSICGCMLVRRDDGTTYKCKHESLERLTVPRPPKPASSQPIDVFRQTVKCDDCGTELNALEACKRTRVVNGRKEYVPGTFCASCPSKPAVPERPKLTKRDPYVCHRESMASILSGSAYELAGMLEESIALQTTKKSERATARIAKRDQALAALSRPLRTGKLRDRDKYGQKLSLKGWDSEDVE